MSKYLIGNYDQNRGNKKNDSKNKLSFKACKKNTINSLNDVEHFLKDFNHFFKYIRLYKILK